MDADEVAQVYIQYPPRERMPIKELKAFRRVHLVKNGEAVIEWRIPLQELQKWDMKQNKWVVYPGEYKINVGSNSRDMRLITSFQVNSKLK